MKFISQFCCPIARLSSACHFAVIAAVLIAAAANAQTTSVPSGLTPNWVQPAPQIPQPNARALGVEPALLRGSHLSAARSAQLKTYSDTSLTSCPAG